MFRIRKFLVPTTAALVGFGVAAPLVSGSTIPSNDSTVALSAGGRASINCAGASLSETLQSATSMSVVCNPSATPSTTPSTTTSTSPPTTTSTTSEATPTTTTTRPITPPSGTPGCELGLYNNGTTASQLGVTEQVVSDYAYDPNWTTYAPSGAVAASGKLLMLAVGALTPAQATEIGTILADNGQPDAVIRPMWEMNQGSWFPQWNENAMSAATYKATWIAMVDAFRSVPGTDFKFDYNINAGTGNNVNGRSNFDNYPGNAYVDYIGEDIYDNTDSVAAAQAEITEMTNFAQVMGLPWSLPEWGMNGPDDDPAFVNMISSETKQPSCWEEALFSEPWSSSGLGSNILDLPNSTAAYEADFGSSTTSTTTDINHHDLDHRPGREYYDVNDNDEAGYPNLDHNVGSGHHKNHDGPSFRCRSCDYNDGPSCNNNYDRSRFRRRSYDDDDNGNVTGSRSSEQWFFVNREHWQQFLVNGGHGQRFQ